VAQHATDTAALGIDAYLSGTVMHAEESALQSERARHRATEQRLPVAVASFAGPTGGGYERTAGCSGIWNADGTLLDQAGPDPGAIARATLG
jgi:predicted amidohydrolase